MNKKDNVKMSLEWIRKGYTITYYIDEVKHYAYISNDEKYIYIDGYGSWRCKNTYKDWYGEFGTAKDFDILR